MPGALQVRLLGQFRLTVDGRPVDGPHDRAAAVAPRLSAPPCGWCRSRGLSSPSLSGRTPRSRTPATTCGSSSTSCGRRCPNRTATSGPMREQRALGSRLLLQPRRHPLRPCGRCGRGGRPGGRRLRAPRLSGAGSGPVSGAPAPEVRRRLDRTRAGASRAAVRGRGGGARGPARGAARVRERHRPRPALAATRPPRRGGASLAHAAAGAGRRSGGRAPGRSPVRRRAPQGGRPRSRAPRPCAPTSGSAAPSSAPRRHPEGAKAFPPRPSSAGKPSGRGSVRHGSGPSSGGPASRW